MIMNRDTREITTRVIKTTLFDYLGRLCSLLEMLEVKKKI